MRLKTNNKNIKIQRGSSLLETMVSLFVLAIGLLGTLAMQTKSIQHNQNSFSYSRAIVLANDITEQLKIAKDRSTVKSEWENKDPLTDKVKDSLTDKVKDILPGGSVTISGISGAQTITINFSESAAAGAILKEADHSIKFKVWL